MYINNFIFNDTKAIYPQYLDKDARKELKDTLSKPGNTICCGCRNDIKLMYLISEDLRIYPAHNNYVHTNLCIRNVADSSHRKLAFQNNENNNTVFLNFDPLKFTIPKDDSVEVDSHEEETEENTPDSDELSDETEHELLSVKAEKKIELEKDSVFNFNDFIRALNYDTFNERLIQNKSLLYSNYFINSVKAKSKTTLVSGMKKMLGDLSIENDKIRFIYGKFLRCDIKHKDTYDTYTVVIEGYNNTEVRLFTYKQIYEKELTRFRKTYGIEPNENTMIAGFQYLRTSKSFTEYKVFGRLILFQVNKYGLYAETLPQVDYYNCIIDYYKRHINYMSLYLPVENNDINAILYVNGKQGVIVFPGHRKSKEIDISTLNCEILVIKRDTELTVALLDEFIHKLK